MGQGEHKPHAVATADVAHGTTEEDGGRVASDYYIVNVMGLQGKA